jgi:hypothetical protein
MKKLREVNRKKGTVQKEKARTKKVDSCRYRAPSEAKRDKKEGLDLYAQNLLGVFQDRSRKVVGLFDADILVQRVFGLPDPSRSMR